MKLSLNNEQKKQADMMRTKLLLLKILLSILK